MCKVLLMDDQARKSEILLEIESLKHELAQRRRAERPAPTCVIRAYQAAIQKQYERLDGLQHQQSTLLP